jgi:hypothetical protein
VARYANGGIEYTTMNPKRSSVVWGIPQRLEESSENMQNENDRYAASIFQTVGSLSMIVSILALSISVVSMSMLISSKKDKSFEESENEE